MGDKVFENPAALRAAVFLLSAKNRREVFKHPPPPQHGRAKVNQAIFYTQTAANIRVGLGLRTGLAKNMLICCEAAQLE